MRISGKRAVTICVGNPFAVDEATWSAAAATLRRIDAPTLLKLLLGRGDVHSAKLLVLAIGHVAACEFPDQPARVLTEKRAPARLLRRLPRETPEYLRIVMAAGRAHRALSVIQGRSQRLNDVRRRAWAACFGESLYHALRLQQVIRDSDVVILGETGTGKEAVARAIQEGTPGGPDGKRAPSSALNAAAIPDTLIESELFGHVRGAFTGATANRTGHIRTAHEGCLFLDEVGDLQLTTQVKLLRVMESNEVTPLGSDTSRVADTRYVAATHTDLAAMVEEGRFRRDLYQRLAATVIRLPPLRERPEDIVDIGLAFVRRYTGVADAEVDTRPIEQWLRSPEALEYRWPGNVRELQNVLRNLMLGLSPELGMEPGERGMAAGLHRLPTPVLLGNASLREASDWYIGRVLDRHGNNYTAAARVLGVDRSTVKRRAARHR